MKNGLEGLEESVLPLVAKPGRYVAPPGLRISGDFDRTRLRLCVLSPETFETAAASPLLCSLFTELGRLTLTLPAETFLYDLAALPEADLLTLLIDRDLPPFSLTYRRPLWAFDVLLILAPGLLSFSRTLRLLSLAGIPDRGEERGPAHPLVLLGSDAAWYPETAAAYVDAFLLGDPEALVEDVLAALGRYDRSHAERREALFRLSEVEGVLVPSFPSALRAPGGRWRSHLGPALDGGLTPLIETSAEGAMMEIGRPVGPRCSASAPRSMRFRGVEETVLGAARLLERTGEGELLLAGEGAARHPALAVLLETLNLRFAPEGVHVRVNEVDASSFTPAVARELQKARRVDLHFAPVPASERLRERGNRTLSRVALEESVATALRGEWGGVRLAILLGVPGETEEDRGEAIDVLERLATSRGKTSKRPHLSVELRPFVPVRHTPWENEPGIDVDDWMRIVSEWRHRLGRNKIRVVASQGAAAQTEAMLRRGGEAVGEFLPEIGTWWECLPPDPEGAARVLAQKWAELAPRVPEVSSRSARIPLALIGEFAGGPAEIALSSIVDRISGGARTADEGRRPRREGRARDVRQSDRFRLRAAKDERVRFISHLAVTRAFCRAFRKSRLPVAVTGGKERRLKIAFGPPLPLGMTSGAEFLDVVFVREVPEPFVSSLNESLPEGLTVVASAPMRTEPDSLSSVIQIATYEVSFPDSLIRRYLRGMTFDELRARLEDRVVSVKASSRVDVTKGRGSERKTFNARPSMLRAEVVRDDGGRPVLSLALTLNRPDSARPELWTAALLDWAHVDERLLRVHRSGLYIPGRQSWLDPLDVVAPGFEWWRQPVRGGTVS
jgi:radical SAM-linked protein